MDTVYLINYSDPLENIMVDAVVEHARNDTVEQKVGFVQHKGRYLRVHRWYYAGMPDAPFWSGRLPGDTKNQPVAIDGGVYFRNVKQDTVTYGAYRKQASFEDVVHEACAQYELSGTITYQHETVRVYRLFWLANDLPVHLTWQTTPSLAG